MCPLCGGSGWRQVIGSANQQVTRCNCFVSAQVNSLLAASDIPARYAACTFSNYKTESNPALAVARITLEKWANQYPLDRTGLLLIGPSGVGKTHLAVAALKELTTKGVHARFCDYRELLKQIQNSYNPSVQATELEVLRPVFEAEVLLLDDLGAVKPSEWVWDTVSLVLNARYNATSPPSSPPTSWTAPAPLSIPPAALTAKKLSVIASENACDPVFSRCAAWFRSRAGFRPNFRATNQR